MGAFRAGSMIGSQSSVLYVPAMMRPVVNPAAAPIQAPRSTEVSSSCRSEMDATSPPMIPTVAPAGVSTIAERAAQIGVRSPRLESIRPTSASDIVAESPVA